MKSSIAIFDHPTPGEVQAGAEMRARAVQHQRFHLRRERGYASVELRDHRVAQRIAFVRPIELQHADGAAPLELQRFEFHLRDPG